MRQTPIREQFDEAARRLDEQAIKTGRGLATSIVFVSTRSDNDLFFDDTVS